jgi:hypothetical protein
MRGLFAGGPSFGLVLGHRLSTISGALFLLENLFRPLSSQI